MDFWAGNSFLSFFFYIAAYLIFKIEIQLVYNIMLVSDVQCHVLSFSTLQMLHHWLLRTLVSNEKPDSPSNSSSHGHT